MRKRRAESASGVDQEDERERTTAEVSKLVDDIRTEGWSCPWEKSGRYLFTAQTVSGV
jgi:hypothetical protein